jgi:malonyl-CoA/methylmalonyl-CoA synthetase
LGDQKDLNQARVAFRISPGFDYVAAQWEIWQSGGIAVPLCISYPPPYLNYVLKDTQAEILITKPGYLDIWIF